MELRQMELRGASAEARLVMLHEMERQAEKHRHKSKPPKPKQGDPVRWISERCGYG